MAYEAHRSIGDTEHWEFAGSPGYVYVWRTRADAVVDHPDDARLFARAVGQAAAQNQPFAIDVRGVVVHNDHHVVDVVFTVPSAIILWNEAGARAIERSVMADTSVRARWPSLELSDSEGLYVTAPAAAIDFWRSQPVLWDSTLGSRGGPTQAFADQHGLYVGTAADEWQSLKPMVSVPGVPVPAQPPSAGSPATPLVWIIGTALVVWLASSRIWRSA